MESGERVFLCREEDISPGQIRFFPGRGGRSVALARTTQGGYYAFHPFCPHHGAPLWKGQLTWLACGEVVGENRTSREEQILRCPWHGFEYDLQNGAAVVGADRLRIKCYPVLVDDGSVYLAES